MKPTPETTLQTTRKTTPEGIEFTRKPREPRLMGAPHVRACAGAGGRAYVWAHTTRRYWRGSRGFPYPYSFSGVVTGVVRAWFEAWLGSEEVESA